jgi:hypothetical protein
MILNCMSEHAHLNVAIVGKGILPFQRSGHLETKWKASKDVVYAQSLSKLVLHTPCSPHQNCSGRGHRLWFSSLMIHKVSLLRSALLLVPSACAPHLTFAQ